MEKKEKKQTKKWLDIEALITDLKLLRARLGLIYLINDETDAGETSTGLMVSAVTAESMREGINAINYIIREHLGRAIGSEGNHE